MGGMTLDSGTEKQDVGDMEKTPDVEAEEVAADKE